MILTGHDSVVPVAALLRRAHRASVGPVCVRRIQGESLAEYSWPLWPKHGLASHLFQMGRRANHSIGGFIENNIMI